MAKNTVTIYDMLTELETWMPLDDDIRKKAEKSNMNTDNNKHFAILVKSWSNGVYDEYVDQLHYELVRLLERVG